MIGILATEMKAVVVASSLIALLSTSPLYAGPLKDFENAAQPQQIEDSDGKINTAPNNNIPQKKRHYERKRKKHPVDHGTTECHSCDKAHSIDGIFSILELFIDIASTISDVSDQLSEWQETSTEESNDEETQQQYSNVDQVTALQSDPSPASVILSINRMFINDGISAIDGSVEISVPVIRFGIRQTKFNDNKNNESLQLKNGYIGLLNRPRRQNSLGLEFGQTTLEGERSKSGLFISTPLHLVLGNQLFLNIKPSRVTSSELNIWDIDTSINFALKPLDILLGYRYLDNNGESLQGAYMGISKKF